MKKLKVLFLTTLSLLIMVSGTAFAFTVDSSSEVGTSDYVFPYHGSSTFCAIGGDSNQAYTTLTNEATASRYLTSSTWEYKYNIGWVDKNDSTGTYGTGGQVACGVSREKSMYGFYQHYAKCYANTYSNQVYDDFFYKAMQSYNN